MQNNQVRVIAQRIPHNGGAAVQGPITIANTVVTLNGNATTVNDISLQACLNTYLAVNDYIQINVYHDRGTDMDITGGTFSMVRL